MGDAGEDGVSQPFSRFLKGEDRPARRVIDTAAGRSPFPWVSLDPGEEKKTEKGA